MVRDNTAQGVAWTALILALISLILAWTAFNRAGEDLHEEVQDELNQAVFEIEQGWDVLEARTRLLALRADIIAERAYDEAAEEVAEVRADLEAAYADASAEVREEWREMDAELEQLENDLREGSADAVGSLERSLDALERDIRTDED